MLTAQQKKVKKILGAVGRLNRWPVESRGDGCIQEALVNSGDAIFNLMFFSYAPVFDDEEYGRLPRCVMRWGKPETGQRVPSQAFI